MNPQPAKQPSERFTVLPGKDDKGKPVFSVLVKRTYDIITGRPLVRAEQTAPFVEIDDYYDHGDPQTATVKFESELTAFKAATDVVVIGKAYAPGGTPVEQMDLAVQIGSFLKKIRIIGDRHCTYRKGRTPLVSDPLPFTEMQIRYEKAYGGRDLLSNPLIPFSYPRNPMGTGVAVANNPEVVNQLALPNLEDPEDLLTPERIIMEDPNSWNRQPLPQGLGWYQKTWYPRSSFVGALPGFVDVDEIMREETLGWVPPKQIALAKQFKLPAFDIRFNNGASPDLIRPYLTRNELLVLTNMTPDGRLEFTLPNEAPGIILDIGLGRNELTPALQTVCIRVEDRQVDLIWQGAHAYPGLEWLPEMKRMDVGIGS